MSEIDRLVWAVRESAQKQAAMSLQEGPEMDVRAFVRAILTAMREPSEEADEAGLSATYATADVEFEGPERAYWRGVIDHILNEDEGLGYHGVKARDRK